MATKVVREPTYGYLRLDPIPTRQELSEYYRERYFETAEKEDKAQEIARQQKGGDESSLELEWLSKTLYRDILAVLGEFCGSQRRLLDIGCGTGAFLKCAKDKGWDVVGVEPSKEGCGMVRRLGMKVFNMGLDEFTGYNQKGFDAITMVSVLEHVPNPYGILSTVKNLLNPHGIICVRVPNDFSVLQRCTEEKLNKKEWWVVSPDHINYFNFESLQKLMEGVGLEVIHKTTDFPMELFLLMGEDYIESQKIGSVCHKKRRNFEMAIPDGLRRRIYKSLAEFGVGRSCIMFARAES